MRTKQLSQRISLVCDNCIREIFIPLIVEELRFSTAHIYINTGVGSKRRITGYSCKIKVLRPQGPRDLVELEQRTNRGKTSRVTNIEYCEPFSNNSSSGSA